MALLLLRSEAACLVHQHKQNSCLIHHRRLSAAPYRASGLVLRPEVARLVETDFRVS